MLKKGVKSHIGKRANNNNRGFKMMSVVGVISKKNQPVRPSQKFVQYFNHIVRMNLLKTLI